MGGGESACLCVFAVPIYFPSFFALALVLVNDLLFSGFSFFCFCFCFLEMHMILFFVFVFVCFFLLNALVFYVYCRVLPDVPSLKFFQVPPLGFLK